MGSERRRVGGGGAGGPRVVSGRLAGCLGPLLGALALRRGLIAGGLGHLRYGVRQARADRADREGRLLVLDAVLLPALRTELAGDQHLHALLQRLADVLGEVFPGGAAVPEGVAVLPLLGLRVEAPGVESQPYGRDGLAGLAETQLRIGDEAGDTGDGGQRHG